MITDAREQLAQTANAALTMLYWNLGSRLHREILGEKRAEYGKRIVAAVGRQLSGEFGSGFSEKNLWRMMQFAELFPDGKILATLSRQLGWSHFKELLPLDQPMQREFYAEICRIERWSVRTLRNKIGSLLFERTAISKKPEEVAKAEIAALRNEDRLTPDLVFRDPYILDFLGLKDRYLEKDLEDAILREIEAFLLELGDGFAFVGRQVRIQIDGDDFYLDLLFYHRRLRRLIAIDLKLGDFKAEHKGQMELYLRWLAKHEQQPGEDSPLGIILCAGKKEEQIELLELDRSGIHVAEYLTALPPRELLKQKLHAAIENSRARLESREGGGE
ncbi:PDDEXK nuclease domain-containing protein [Thiorhodovibrio winogradskyi]|nr:PDDEXK nuclease domain-containing protein [Thiorhodovibrio winogradskyi]